MGEAKVAAAIKRRAYAMARVHELINDPAILPAFVGSFYNHVSLSAFFSNPDNVICLEGPGAMIFAAIPDKPGWYDAHYIFPRAPGGMVLDAARRCVREMFVNYDALVLCGCTPRSNRAARLINRALGAEPKGESVDSLGRPVVFYALERAKWMARHAD